MTKARAIQTLVAALKRLDISDEQVGKVLDNLGLDALSKKAKAKKLAARAVSTEKQVEAARPGVYRVVGVQRLYLRKTTDRTGSYFVRWRIQATEADKQHIKELTATAKHGSNASERAAAAETLARFREERDRKRSEIGLGSIVNVTLAEAKARANQISVALEAGVDPRAERSMHVAAKAEAAKVAERRATIPTVAQVVDAYVNMRLTSKTKPWRHDYAKATFYNPIRNYALPLIGDLMIDAVTSQDILKVVQAIDEKGLAVTAGKVRSSLGTVFKYAKAKGLRTGDNPADAGEVNAGRAGNGRREKTEHYGRVEPAKAPAVFKKLLAAAQVDHPKAKTLRTALSAWAFMALTAARPGDVLAAKWSEIDLGAKGWPVWHNPVSKTQAPLDVPLSATALAIIEQQRARSTSDLVFAGNGGGEIAHSNFATSAKRAGITDAANPHGWRSTFRDTIQDELGYPHDIAELCLGHVLGETTRAYRRDDAIEKRREMMTAYEQHLTREDVDNVVPLDRARSA